jgi:hypothetical protein
LTTISVPGHDGYANGDFNYDGVIDAGDYGIIDNSFQLQGAPIPSGSGVGIVGRERGAGAGIVVGDCARARGCSGVGAGIDLAGLADRPENRSVL